MSARLLLKLLAVAATSLGVMMAAGHVTLDEVTSCGSLPSSGTYTDGSQYEKNLAELLAVLSSAAAAGVDGSLIHFHSGSVSGGGAAAPGDQAWGLATCYADSNYTRCQDCLGKVATVDGLTELCPSAAHMRSVSFSDSDACRLRYADAPFLGSADTGDMNQRTSYGFDDDVDVADRASMNATRWRLLSQLAEAAAGHDQLRLAYGSLPYTDARNGTQVVVYGLAQCTADLEHSECTRCLEFLLANMDMTNATGGSVSVFSCYLRYQVNEPILDGMADPAPSPQPSVHNSGAAPSFPLGSEGSKAPLIAAAAAVAVVLLVAGV